MLDNERTEMHVLIRIESQILRIVSFGSDLGKNNKFLKLFYHKPRESDFLHYKPKLKKQLVILPIV